jgi:hypothetical protein
MKLSTSLSTLYPQTWISAWKSCGKQTKNCGYAMERENEAIHITLGVIFYDSAGLFYNINTVGVMNLYKIIDLAFDRSLDSIF